MFWVTLRKRTCFCTSILHSHFCCGSVRIKAPICLLHVAAQHAISGSVNGAPALTYARQKRSVSPCFLLFSQLPNSVHQQVSDLNASFSAPRPLAQASNIFCIWIVSLLPPHAFFILSFLTAARRNSKPKLHFQWLEKPSLLLWPSQP